MRKPVLSLVAALAAFPLLALTRAERLRAKFDSDDTNYVFVVAHRSDWRAHPENSISAIESAIAMGCDMVEIDVAKTKDGVHVLSHDGKLDRVSDRTGAVADLTLAEVKAARLREGRGGANAALTDERVPTLVEALEACRGRILVNIDKFNKDPEGITAVVEKTGVARQVVLKGGGDYGKMKAATGAPWRFVEDRTFVYMPIVNSGRDEAALAKVRAAVAAWDRSPYAPPAYEVCIPGEAPLALFEDLRKSPNRPRLWVNTLWDSLAHGHSESLKGKDFTADRVWGWWVGLGATMLQTDRPAEAVRYLTERGLHTLTAPLPAPIETVKGELDDICGHVQGIACTDEAIYVAHMEGIYRLDWNGRLVKSAKGPSHIGGICVHEGRVYAPIIRREKASVVGDDKGMIKVYDADLNPVSEHLYADGISSLVFFKDCFYGGLVEDKAPHATNRIARYDRDLRLVDVRPFDYGEPTRYGAQVLAVQGENLRMFFYSSNGAVLCDGELNVLAKGRFKASEGFARVPASRSNGEELYLKVAALGGNSRKWKKGTNPPQVRFVFVRPDGTDFR